MATLIFTEHHRLFMIYKVPTNLFSKPVLPTNIMSTLAHNRCGLVRFYVQ